MEIKSGEKMKALASILKLKAENAKNSGRTNIVGDYYGFINSNSMLFRGYGFLPTVESTENNEYINSLFSLRELVGYDILVSDLVELQDYRKRGELEEFGRQIKNEQFMFYLVDKNGDIESLRQILGSGEIRKFYISSSGISFFSGVDFYIPKSSGKPHRKAMGKENESTGELILKEINEREKKQFKSGYVLYP